jgi:hypothetical protein
MVVEETITHRLALHRYLDGVKPGAFFNGCIAVSVPVSTVLASPNPKRPVICRSAMDRSTTIRSRSMARPGAQSRS